MMPGALVLSVEESVEARLAPRVCIDDDVAAARAGAADSQTPAIIAVLRTNATVRATRLWRWTPHASACAGPPEED
jgi:hypothetical protein